MKYFKPGLLARYRSEADEVAEPAAMEWEKATSAYNAMLDQIRRLFPAGVRSLLRHFSLHDARLLGIKQGANGTFLSFLIRLENTTSAPGALLEIVYTLARQPGRASFHIVSRNSATAEPRPLDRIMYDEFGKVEKVPVRVFSHSLLLANGLELQIRFSKLVVRPLKCLILPFPEQVESSREQ